MSDPNTKQSSQHKLKLVHYKTHFYSEIILYAVIACPDPSGVRPSQPFKSDEVF